MSILNLLGSTITDAVDFLVEKNRYQAQLNRLKMIMKAETQKINDTYLEMGKKYYEEIKDEQDNQPYSEELQKIEKAKARLKKAQECYCGLKTNGEINPDIYEGEPDIKACSDKPDQSGEIAEKLKKDATELSCETKEKISVAAEQLKVNAGKAAKVAKEKAGEAAVFAKDTGVQVADFAKEKAETFKKPKEQGIMDMATDVYEGVDNIAVDMIEECNEELPKDENCTEDVVAMTDDISEKITEKATEVKAAVLNKAEEIKESAADIAEDVKQKAEDAADTIVEKTKEVKDTVVKKADNVAKALKE